MRIGVLQGHILDPLTGKDGLGDLWIRDGRIEKITEPGTDPSLFDQVVDAAGAYVMPGFIDLHVHFREPGYSYKETLATGGAAAVRGGVTTVCAMPNTNPVIDTGEAVEWVHQKAEKESPARIIQIGAVTKGQAGEELADIAAMARAGCHAVSEDGKSVMDAGLYRKGMEAAREAGISVFAHCEDANLVAGGVMNADEKALALGLKGITNTVEDVIVARDILLAKETGVHLHLCHCSTRDSVRMVELAKEAGVRVSAEVCPHHFILTTQDIPGDNGIWKMNPPLRRREDVEALREGLRKGIIDAIATDHAPHAREEKEVPMAQAAFGIVGLETSASLTYTELVKPGILTPLQMAERMSLAPARILGLTGKGSLSAGKDADVVVFDPKVRYTIDVRTFASKGRNTPFDGRMVEGQVRTTLVGGKIVYGA